MLAITNLLKTCHVRNYIKPENNVYRLGFKFEKRSII